MFEILILGLLVLGFITINKAKEDAEESRRKYEKDMEDYEEKMREYGLR